MVLFTFLDVLLHRLYIIHIHKDVVPLCMYVRIYVDLYLCVVYIHTYIYMYIYTYLLLWYTVQGYSSADSGSSQP